LGVSRSIRAMKRSKGVRCRKTEDNGDHKMHPRLEEKPKNSVTTGGWIAAAYLLYKKFKRGRCAP